MLAVEAVRESVWGMAEHPSGRWLARTGNDLKHPGYTLDLGSSLSLEFDKERIAEVLCRLGLDDDAWYPLGPEGLYDVIVLSEGVEG